jgi:hypothetical protein
MSRCGGRLAYEVLAGERVFREDAGGRRVFRWLCERCGEAGSGDGTEETHGPRARRKRLDLSCLVCAERPRSGMLFCAACARSWDRDAERDTTFAAAVAWAARRARMFERRRGRRCASR